MSGRHGTVLYTLLGGAFGDGFGAFADGIGDIDGDGAGDIDGDNVPDFMIGSVGADHGGVLRTGEATVYSGRDGAVIHQFFGEMGDFLGAHVAGAGDVDCDGFADVLIGAPGSGTF